MLQYIMNSQPLEAYYHCVFETPIGQISWLCDHEGVLSHIFLNELQQKQWVTQHPQVSLIPSTENFLPHRDIYAQLKTYFGYPHLPHLFNLTLSLNGTDFQCTVWQALANIPYGETWSYQNLAHYIGRDKAVRAVGNANANNPLPIILPCHRVVQKNHHIGGYAGGVMMKEWLLAHEKL